MNMLTEYWHIIFALVIGTTVLVLLIRGFLKLATEEQLKKVREWLLLAVTEAEIELGTGTGRLKLGLVYDLFITRFRWVSTFISFETFSNLVDQALDEMRNLLATNKAINEIVDPGNELKGGM